MSQGYPPPPGPGMLPAATLAWGASAGAWTSGVCDCCDDCGICCKGLFCPCELYSDINEHVKGERDSCCHCFAFCFLPCTYIANCMGLSNRTKLRKMYGLKGGGDCCAHCCCHQCALCQEAREVDFRKHALATTQRAASGGAPVVVQVNAPPQHQQMNPLDYAESGKMVRLASGEMVMVR